jgi:hypothetical protein
VGALAQDLAKPDSPKRLKGFELDLLHGKQLPLARQSGLLRLWSGFVANRPGVDDSGI